jgi:hypothetical protein
MQIPKDVWVNLKRNDKAAEEIKNTGTTRLPYFKLTLPPQQEGGEWVELGVAWKGKKEGSYGFKFAKGVTVTFEKPKDENGLEVLD